jgi:signal transduction histidine kinase
MAYGVAAFASLAFKMPGSNVSLVWLPAGVAVASLWLRGTWLWTAVALTEAVVATLEGNGAFNVIRVVAANTAAPLVAVYLLRRLRFDTALARLRDAVGLLLLSAAGSGAGALLNAVLRLIERGVRGDELSRMMEWWLGDIVGVLVIVPAAFTWTVRTEAPVRLRRGELVALAVLLALVPVLALVAFPRGPAILVSTLYLAVPVQVWAAARLGPRGGGQSFAVVAGGVLLASVTTLGAPYVDPRVSLVLVDGFLVVSAATSIIVAALVAEHARAAAALAEARRLETVRRLAGGLAHDFHNLLTVIFGHVDLLRIDAQQEQVAADLDAIRTAAARAASITQQLLTYGQEVLLHPTRFDVNDLVREVATVQSDLQRPGLTVHLALADRLSPVLTDRDQLGRVVSQLCRRGAAAMPGGGTLTITTLATRLDQTPAGAAAVAIRIEDTGEHLVARGAGDLLEPYAEGLSTGDPSQRASGLELAMADGFARQVHGRILLESAAGRGTSVTIVLPAGPAAE